MARRLAAAISQAPGFLGTPVCGHSASAVTRASCASSSARLDVAHHAGEPGDEPGCSMRNTVSIAWCVSLPAMRLP